MNTPTREELLARPDTSFWLKRALEESKRRDILDALSDAETLQAVLQAEWNKVKMEAA
jgi:hypothetical protein